jgi:hypothetical protein
MIYSPKSTNHVIVDGKWTYPDEWSDAAKVNPFATCSTCSGTAYLYAKHDESCFYFLIDFVSATTLNSAKDGASISIDSSHDGGIPNSDDRRFEAQYSAGGTMAVGTGGPTLIAGKPLPSGVYMNSSLSPSPNSVIPHEIFEFKITFSAFPNSMQTVIGFAASAYTPTQVVLWPVHYTTDNPGSWGEMYLNPTPIPEFDLLGPLTMTGILLATLATQCSRTKKKCER